MVYHELMTFSELSSYFRKLEETSSRISMTEILAELFRTVSTEEIGMVCYLLQGRVAPLYEPIEFGIADKLMMRAIAQAYSVELSFVTRTFKEFGDMGLAAENLAHKVKTPKSAHVVSIPHVFDVLKKVAETGGGGSQEEKIQLLSGLLSEASSSSARYIARIPLGKMRLGFSDMTILDAFSWMLTGDKTHRPTLEAAFDVRPDLGYIGEQVKKHGVHGVSHVNAVVGAPILSALCQRLPDAVEMIKKMGEVDVEPKYDGVRTQIHWTRTENREQKIFVQSYSRNLENTTAMYPELKHVAAQLHARSVILDSEAVGYDAKNDRYIPFQETVTRKRKHDIASVQSSVPLRFFVFDILNIDGKDIMDEPLSKRRAILEKTIQKGNVLCISPHIVTSDVEELRSYHREQIKKGLEGAVVKKWDSSYVPGRRAFNWVKFKEEGRVGKLTDTVDCVVMGYYEGEGKRSGFGIGAFLVGVRKNETFVTITKIGTGVSDEQWKTLKTIFNKHSSKEKPKGYIDVDKTLTPDTWIDPAVVVEIAADDITVSPIHGAGYALRFPRLVRVRDDKGPHDATSTEELKRMYHNQESIEMNRTKNNKQ